MYKEFYNLQKDDQKKIGLLKEDTPKNSKGKINNIDSTQIIVIDPSKYSNENKTLELKTNTQLKYPDQEESTWSTQILEIPEIFLDKSRFETSAKYSNNFSNVKNSRYDHFYDV